MIIKAKVTSVETKTGKKGEYTVAQIQFERGSADLFCGKTTKVGDTLFVDAQLREAKLAN